MLAGGAVLTYAIIWAMGADGRDIGAVLSAMVREPWSVVALIDLYLGFFIAAVLMVLTERRWWFGLLLALPVFILGNIWTAVWFALRLPRIAERLRP